MLDVWHVRHVNVIIVVIMGRSDRESLGVGQQTDTCVRACVTTH